MLKFALARWRRQVVKNFRLLLKLNFVEIQFKEKEKEESYEEKVQKKLKGRESRWGSQTQDFTILYSVQY